MFYLLIAIISSSNLKVSGVLFYGNKHFSVRNLKTVIHTTPGKPYEEFQLKMDERRIINFYKAKGFKKASISKVETEINDNKKRILCKFYIKEGPGTYVKDIIFEGNDNFSSAFLKNMTKLKQGKLLNEELIILAKYSLADFYANKGYAYAEINDSIIELEPEMGPFLAGFDSSKVTICFKINEGKIAKFGDIKLKGKLLPRKEIIIRELTFKKGNTYSPTKLYESQAKIYGTELFQTVKFELPDIENAQRTQSQPETLQVIFNLEEKQPRWVGIGGGIETDQDIRTWIESGWGHMNLWGNGQKLELKGTYKINPLDFQKLQEGRFDILYLEPYFVNSSLKAQISPFYEFEAGKTVDSSDSKDTLRYKLEDGGIQGKIGKYIGKFLQSFISYSYKLVGKEGAVNEKGGTANSITFALSWDSRDDVFYPRRGALSSISYEFAGGKILGGNYIFKKFLIDFAYYCPFLKTHVVASRFKFGAITGNSPHESKFLLGGTNAIRGYENMVNQPDGQNWFGTLNFEYRIPIFKNFELGEFIDVGNLWTSKDEISPGNIKIGIGFGLRYRTPIGPLRIDYGFGLTENAKGRPYFNIGYMF